MYSIKYCGQWNYRPHAESLSAKINSLLGDTCEIEEGETGQFDVFLSGKLVASKAQLGRFVEFEDLDIKRFEDEKKEIIKRGYMSSYE